MKRLSTKVPEGLHKTQSLHFEGYFTDKERDISHAFIHFFFCPTNLRFKLNLVLIE